MTSTRKMNELHDGIVAGLGDWSHLLDDEEVETVCDSSSSDGGEWTAVTVGKPVVIPVAHEETRVRQPRWCQDGNACQWRECGYGHEPCELYYKTGRCRSLQSDPRSCLCPEQGGCKYDHRNVAALPVRPPRTVPLTSETDLWNHFGELRLEGNNQGVYDVSRMLTADVKRLKRSLNESKVADLEFDWVDGEDRLIIDFHFREEEVEHGPMPCPKQAFLWRNDVEPVTDEWKAWATEVGVYLP